MAKDRVEEAISRVVLLFPDVVEERQRLLRRLAESLIEMHNESVDQFVITEAVSCCNERASIGIYWESDKGEVRIDLFCGADITLDEAIKQAVFPGSVVGRCLTALLTENAIEQWTCRAKNICGGEK